MSDRESLQDTLEEKILARLKAIANGETDTVVDTCAVKRDLEQLETIRNWRYVTKHKARTSLPYTFWVFLSFTIVFVLSMLPGPEGRLRASIQSSLVSVAAIEDIQLKQSEISFQDFRITSISAVDRVTDEITGADVFRTALPEVNIHPKGRGSVSRIDLPKGAKLIIEKSGPFEIVLYSAGATVILSLSEHELCSAVSGICADVSDPKLYRLSSQNTVIFRMKLGSDDKLSGRSLLRVSDADAEINFGRVVGQQGRAVSTESTVDAAKLIFAGYGDLTKEFGFGESLIVDGNDTSIEISTEDRAIVTNLNTQFQHSSKFGDNDFAPSMLQWLVGNPSIGLLFTAALSLAALLINLFPTRIAR